MRRKSLRRIFRHIAKLVFKHCKHYGLLVRIAKRLFAFGFVCAADNYDIAADKGIFLLDDRAADRADISLDSALDDHVAAEGQNAFRAFFDDDRFADGKNMRAGFFDDQRIFVRLGK